MADNYYANHRLKLAARVRQFRSHDRKFEQRSNKTEGVLSSFQKKKKN